MSGVVEVIKIGGSLLAQPAQLRALFAGLAQQQHSTVIVHGGGAAVDNWLAGMGLQTEKRDGLRVSHEQQMPLIVGALAGYANKQLMSYVIEAGLQPTGLSLWETGMRCKALSSELGQVGICDEEQSQVSEWMNWLLEHSHLSIISCIGFDANGGWYNVNADNAAAALAQMLKAKLTFVTDVDGVYDQQQQLIPQLDSARYRHLCQQGVISGGMKVKVDSALATARQLRRSVRICGCACLTRPESGTTIVD